MARPKGLLMIILIKCKKGHMSLGQLCTLQCSDGSEIKTSLSRSVTNIKGRPPRKKKHLFLWALPISGTGPAEIVLTLAPQSMGYPVHQCSALQSQKNLGSSRVA